MNNDNKIIAIEYNLYNKNLFRYWTLKQAKNLNTSKPGLKGFYDHVKMNNNKTCIIKLLINIKGA